MLRTCLLLAVAGLPVAGIKLFGNPPPTILLERQGSSRIEAEEAAELIGRPLAAELAGTLKRPPIRPNWVPLVSVLVFVLCLLVGVLAATQLSRTPTQKQKDSEYSTH